MRKTAFMHCSMNIQLMKINYFPGKIYCFSLEVYSKISCKIFFFNLWCLKNPDFLSDFIFLNIKFESLVKHNSSYLCRDGCDQLDRECL